MTPRTVKGSSARAAPRRTPVIVSTRAVILNTLFLLGSVAIASVQWWPVYQDIHFVILVAVVAATGSLIAIFGAYFRASTAVIVIAGIVDFFALGVPLAVPSAAVSGLLPSLDGVRELLASTALGWKQLLTITLPVGSYQALLVPVFVLELVAVVAGLTVALRARAGDLAVLAPVAILVTGIGFGPESARWPFLLSLSLLAVILSWLIWRRWERRRAAIARLTAATTDVGAAPAVAGEHRTVSGRTILSGIAIMAVAGVTAVGATTLLPPSGQREVLRSSIVQPFDPRDYSSPLSGFRRYLAADSAEAVIFTVSGLPTGAFLRVATLDSYDGIVYSVGSDAVDSASGSFTRVPFRFDQDQVSGEQVQVDVVVGDYDGVWVPTVGQLESVRFAGPDATELDNAFYYNDNAATGAVIGGLSQGDGYSLEAVIPDQPTASQLADLTPGSAEVPAIGVLPAELDLVLSDWTSSSSSPGEQLVAMLAAMDENGYISHGISPDEPTSRSGHSADRVTQLLTDQRMIGDAEQYSVTAALMARELGFPARVVFGFDTAADESAAGAASTGPVMVTGSEVSARIEVDTAEYGWVSIDPTPSVRDIPDERPEDPTIVSRPPSVIQPPIDEPPVRNQQTPPETRQQDPEQLSPLLAILGVVGRIALWALLGLAIVLSPFVVIIGAKLRRRRARRRAGSAVERISGGWNEFRDAAVDHGFTIPPAATRSQVAASVGGAGPVVLATIADRAIFSPGDPDVADADRVWKASGELRAGLDRGLTRWQRIKAAVSLRSFAARSPKTTAQLRQPQRLQPERLQPQHPHTPRDAQRVLLTRGSQGDGNK